MFQVEHAAREEKDCLEKFHRKWEQLDPLADNEKAKALEAQKVKEHAQAEADRCEGRKSCSQTCMHDLVTNPYFLPFDAGCLRSRTACARCSTCAVQ